MEDQEIIALFFARSERAIEALAEKYGVLCRRLADNILHDRQDVEECLNDAWLGVWNSVPPHRPDPLVSYVCRIVRNQAVKKYHAKTAAKRRQSYDVALEEIEACFPSRDTVEAEADLHAATEAIDRFLGTLDRDSRVLFVRRYWYGDSIEALADAFGISRHYVSVRLARIRKKLQNHLRKEEIWL